MSQQERKLHLNAFLAATGHHEASWRHADTHPERAVDINHYLRLARIAERGLLDSVFLADGYWAHAGTLEPFTLLSALAAATKHIGLIATVETTYNQPFHVARKFASLDHISKGRAGWNIVTGAGPAAAQFSREQHPEHHKRYESAEEFVEIVKRLWDSWDDDAVRNDKHSGVLYDESKIHKIDWSSANYAVKGPLNIARPVQGYPVLVQAGSSETGKEFAAKFAEVIFTAQLTIEEARDFYRDVKSRLPKYGRTLAQLQILPGLSPILADTEAEARELEQELFELIDKKGAIQRLSSRLGVDLSNHPLDEPLTLEGIQSADEVSGMKSRHKLIVDLIEREQPTLRQVINTLAGARGHFTFTGTPLQLADTIEQWFQTGAADGFNIMPQIYPSGLETFVDKVIPELQNRGLFRTEYEDTTLRGKLGLARPSSIRHSSQFNEEVVI
ncbi:FMN-dependent oxidoreductase (nitrilotriacetate monooxygenase family) [Paenibacillus phyllosphaerae]|uniref:FMN-dependent oxidoreductase (Nitrilotriacetate monooxygenase family) n=1 Tax=Paenibacillus phyllosphaerae TaxID=274593 RepID=A0A7W5AZB7_9BACL|nr:LLM class flavin-dependent oxidoreductase [Paenibacillus phyllosphaerae]MBB3111422.1 FMN-dependent oxidoreductase (nitrilotriacetate monooxygenase family) [Paenibacillus phyllosphaerae]